MKKPWDISLQSRTNMIALATIAGGFFKLAFPELANYQGDPLLLITGGFGLLYLRESRAGYTDEISAEYWARFKAENEVTNVG